MRVFHSITFFILICIPAFSQTILYGIQNLGLGNVRFVEIDCNANTLTAKGPAQLHYFASDFSSCYDAINKKYYYSTGQIIYRINALDGQREDTMDFTPMHPFYFDNIEFNSLDGFIYGIKNNIYTRQAYFSRVDPTTGLMTNITQITPYISSGYDNDAALNWELQQYILQSDTITSIDIASGNILYQYPVITTGNVTFSHIAYSCTKQKLYGLINVPNVPEEYFAEIDTSSGILSLVNSAPLPTGFYKPPFGRSCIDNAMDVFFYSAADGVINGVDLASGSLIYSHDFGTGFELLFLEFASVYNCPIANIESSELGSIRLFPNPVQENLYISYNFSKFESLTITNSKGHVMENLQCEFNSLYMVINTSMLFPGVYFLQISTEQGVVAKKFIKL